MATIPPEPKKFDGITFLGLAVALLLLYFSWQHQAKVAQDQRAAAEAAAAEEARRPVTPPNTSEGTGAAGKTPALEVKAVVEAPPIKVEANGIEVEFSARGAVLHKARLLNVFEDAHKKDTKGLEILAEIVDGKYAFGIPRFQIWPDGKQTTSEDALLVDGKPGVSLDSSIWAVKDSGAFDANGIRTIAYSITLDNYTLVKTFTLSNKEEFLRCDFAVENHSESNEVYFYRMNGPQGVLMDDDKIAAHRAGRKVVIQAQLAVRDAVAAGQSPSEPDVIQAYADMKKTEAEEGRFISKASGEMLWGTVKNRFFMATFVSLDPKQLNKIAATPIQYAETESDIRKGDKRIGDDRYIDPNLGILAFRYDCKLSKGTSHSDPYALYLGPADDNHLDMAEAAMLKTVTPAQSEYKLRSAIQFFEMFSWRWPRVDWVARQMMWVFQGLYKLFGNYGIAVVLMTILIKLCLHPLSRKSMKSMSQMQKLAPELNKIKEKYKNATSTEAKMKMAAEQQDVMKKAGVNPAAGCLPMLIQMPIFSSLYGIFYHAFEMRGAQFLWIKDLSQPDRFYTIQSLVGTTSWIPSSINLLPLLYIVLSVIQTRMTPQQKSDDPQQEMNRKMMMFMPVMISFMFYSMPAGLVLYFTVSACWGMLESWYIKKFVVGPMGTPGTTGTAAVTDSKTARLTAKPSR